MKATVKKHEKKKKTHGKRTGKEGKRFQVLEGGSSITKEPLLYVHEDFNEINDKRNIQTGSDVSAPTLLKRHMQVGKKKNG